MFCKAFLAALCLCFPVAAIAASASLPKQFRGDWCGGEDGGYLMRPCASESDTNFRISAHTYGAIKSNWTCTFTSIGFDGPDEEKNVRAVTADSLCVRDYTLKMRSILQLNDDGTLILLSVPIGHRYPQ